jgi:glutathione synthase/RimK-type ligase-like ATP-grasp enzyme
MRILASKRSLPSARLLRDQLQNLSGKRFILSIHPERLKAPPNIRYGNSGGVFDESSVNSAEFVRLCADKKQFSDLMRECEIAAPEFFRAPMENTYDGFPVLIRESLHLSGGKGIILVCSYDEFRENWRTGYWWTPYIPTKYELRVHVLGGEIARIFRKEFAEGDEQPEFPIRNNACCHFSLRNPNNYPKVSSLVEKLNEILGTDCFYALDIGWNPVRKEYIIFEANSAPGLNENTSTLYAEFILRRMEVPYEVRWTGENMEGIEYDPSGDTE